MLSSKNMIVLEGNMVADPESPTDGILTFRMGVNNGGYEGGESVSGFFDVKVFYKGVVESHANFIKRQVESGGFSKSSRVVVIGQLRQERWKAEDGSTRSKILVLAHSVEYVGGEKREEGSEPAPKAAAATSSGGSEADSFVNAF